MVRCSVCGSANVQCAMWVNPNTNEVHEDFGEFNDEGRTWCEECHEHSLLYDDSSETRDGSRKEEK